MTPLKVNTAIMCEFLTQSVGNKHTLVNVIPGDLRVQADNFPARLPVAFYFEVTAQQDEEADYLIEIYFDKRRAAHAVAHIEFEKGKEGVFAIPFGILQADAPGELKVTISREGGRRLTLLRKKILEATDAT